MCGGARTGGLSLGGRLLFLRTGVWTLFAGMRLRCARIYRRGLGLGMFLAMLFVCRSRGGLLVLVFGSFRFLDMDRL